MASRLGAALGRGPVPLLILLVAAYAGTLGVTEFFHDDAWAIAQSAYMRARGWDGFAALFTTGYWETTGDTAGARIHYYRPLLLLSYWLQVRLTGFWAPAFHAANLLLHAAAALLLRQAFLRRLPARAAEAGALLFALAPVQTEAVAMITGRSEVMAALFMLAAWLLLEPGRRGGRSAGVAAFAAATLCKEPAALFPAWLALSDWVFHGRRPWDRDRRGVYLACAGWLGALLLIRRAVLGAFVEGGPALFDSRLTAALTWSRFALRHYAVPALTGLDQCADYRGGLIPAAGTAEPAAWLALTLVLGLLAWAARAAWRRRQAGFWVLGPALLLLPTSHLIAPLDTIGAERFLYLPMAGLAAAAGWFYDRARVSRPRAAAALGAAALVWLTTLTFLRTGAYSSQRAYSSAAAACNPLSAQAWSSLGAAELAAGRREEGLRALEQASRLDPGLATPWYNRARLAFDSGDWETAERQLAEAQRRLPGNADALLLGALIAERRGRPEETRARLEAALRAMPGHPLAEYNLARFWLARGNREKARALFESYLRKYPEDRETAALLRGL